MNAKFSLALIALVSVGVFALPSTVALFAGQHSFYNIDATGNQVPCTKCHGDVKAELSSSGLNTLTGTKGPHADFLCEYCHRSEAGYAAGDNAVATLTYSTTDPSNTTASAVIVTTLQNFESGNFPEHFTGVGSPMNPVNWTGTSAYFDSAETRQFVPNSGLVDEYGNYDGQISYTDAGLRYNFSRRGETAAYANGAPKDTNPTTQLNSLNPQAVTMSGTSISSFDGAGSREVTPGTRYHAASLVSCLECHGGEQAKGVEGYVEFESAEPYMHSSMLTDPTNPTSTCANCHYSTASHTPAFIATLAAGGFRNAAGTGLTEPGSTEEGSAEAHNKWVSANDSSDPTRHGSSGYGASNSACIGCHTHVAVQINFKKGYLLQFNATENPTGVYTVGNFSVNGTVSITVFGNQSGNAFAVSNSTYAWTPTTPMFVNGVQVSSISGANDSIAAWATPAYTPVLTTFTVSPAPASVGLGGTLTFTATTKDQTGKAMTATVTWSSSNTAVGTINATTGVFAAITAGTTTVTATSGAKTATAAVTVGSSAPVLTTISVSPASATVVNGKTQTFTATKLDQYGNANASIVTWSSSNTAVGTINSSTGLFTAVAVGTTTVTAANGSVSGTAAVTVSTSDPVLTTISVSPGTKSLGVGFSQVFTATPKDQFGNTMSGVTVNWIPDSVGTLNTTTGIAVNFTATTIGTGTITASSGSIVGIATVTVAPPYLKTISVSPATVSLGLGSAQTFTATGKDQFSNLITISPATAWSSSNTGVGTISATTGVFTAVAAGTTTISARNGTSGTVIGSATVTVGAYTPVLTTISVSPASATVLNGASTIFTATPKDQNGNPMPVVLTWSGYSAVGTLDTTLSPVVNFTATTAGAATLNVSSGSVIGIATITVP